MRLDIGVSRRKAFELASYSLVIPQLLRALDTSEPAPRFSAKTLTGESFNNQSLMGRVVLIQFWTTWCQYCRRDAEPVDTIVSEFGNNGFVVLAVNVGEPKRKVRSFLEHNPRKAKIVLMEDTNLAAVFEARSYPKYVLLNREGRVVTHQNGSGGEAALRSMLRKAGLASGASDDAPVELQSSPRRNG